MSETQQPAGTWVDSLFSLLYEELRTLAHFRLSKSESITMLDTTSLVHESYVRFVKAGRVADLDPVSIPGICIARHAIGNRRSGPSPAGRAPGRR